MSDDAPHARDALMSLSKEMLIEIIVMQAAAIRTGNEAFERLTNDIAHHATRMGAALESSVVPIVEAKERLDATWRAAAEEMARETQANNGGE